MNGSELSNEEVAERRSDLLLKIELLEEELECAMSALETLEQEHDAETPTTERDQ